MKFEFNFEKVLDHRRKLEDLARRNWLQARAQVDSARDRLQKLYDEIDRARERAGDLGRRGGAQAPALAQVDEFINGQNLRIERQREEVRELTAEMERLQEVLVEAAKEKKILEKLKERRWEEFKIRRRKHELKEIDELVVTRFGRHGSAGEKAE